MAENTRYIQARSLVEPSGISFLVMLVQTVF